MASIQERVNELIEEFSFFDDWSDKYAHIIELGKNMQPLDERLKTEDQLIKGCQSNVWLHAEQKDGKVYFYADSDAIIVKGLIGMLVRIFTGQPAEDILKTDMGFMDKIGLQQHLSPTRSNGLASMVKQIKMYALAFQANPTL